MYAPGHQMDTFPILIDARQGVDFVGSFPGFPPAMTRKLQKHARRQADIVFAWHPYEHPIEEELLFELGVASGLGKFVFLGIGLGAPSPVGLYDMMIARIPNVQDALDEALYLSEKQGFGSWVQMVSKFVGRCTHCRGSYKPGANIMWAKGRGSMHLDCFLQVETNQALMPFAFSAEVVEALRQENSALEQEITNLIGRNASLKRKLDQTQPIETAGASSSESQEIV